MTTYLCLTGKVTSLVAKRDLVLATRIEEALRKNESLESLTVDNVRRDIARSRITEQKRTIVKSVKISNQKNKITRKAKEESAPNLKNKVTRKGKEASTPAKSSKRAVQVSKSVKSSSSANTSRKAPSTSSGKKQTAIKKSRSVKSAASKLSVVGFRGRASWSNKKESLRSS
nr:dead-box atp-dependent rna helicase 39 [Quercus suber]